MTLATIVIIAFYRFYVIYDHANANRWLSKLEIPETTPKKKSKDDASISYQNGIVFNDLTICILYLTIVGKRYHQYKWMK